MTRLTKQVIVMRTDLNMRKGKMIAQGAHASTLAILKGAFVPGGGTYLTIPLDEESTEWLLNASFTKITVSVKSEKELLDIEAAAQEANLRCALITDSGRTEFNGVPTKTCLAIGPNWVDDIDKITGGLKLL